MSVLPEDAQGCARALDVMCSHTLRIHTLRSHVKDRWHRYCLKNTGLKRQTHTINTKHWNPHRFCPWGFLGLVPAHYGIFCIYIVRPWCCVWRLLQAAPRDDEVIFSTVSLRYLYQVNSLLALASNFWIRKPIQIRTLHGWGYSCT